VTGLSSAALQSETPVLDEDEEPGVVVADDLHLQCTCNYIVDVYVDFS